MKNLLLTIFISLIFVGAVSAFTNSLDNATGVNQNNNFKTPTSQTNNFQNRQNTPFEPKQHTGFEHQDRQFPNATMNDARYNSSCQFGTCTPGGINNNR